MRGRRPLAAFAPVDTLGALAPGVCAAACRNFVEKLTETRSRNAKNTELSSMNMDFKPQTRDKNEETPILTQSNRNPGGDTINLGQWATFQEKRTVAIGAFVKASGLARSSSPNFRTSAGSLARSATM